MRVQGIVACLRGLRAAGAYRLLTSNLNPSGSIGGAGDHNHFDEQQFENFIGGIEKYGVQKGRMALFSAHQVGS